MDVELDLIFSYVSGKSDPEVLLQITSLLESIQRPLSGHVLLALKKVLKSKSKTIVQKFSALEILQVGFQTLNMAFILEAADLLVHRLVKLAMHREVSPEQSQFHSFLLFCLQDWRTKFGEVSNTKTLYSQAYLHLLEQGVVFPQVEEDGTLPYLQGIVDLRGALLKRDLAAAKGYSRILRGLIGELEEEIDARTELRVDPTNLLNLQDKIYYSLRRYYKLKKKVKTATEIKLEVNQVMLELQPKELPVRFVCSMGTEEDEFLHCLDSEQNISGFGISEEWNEIRWHYGEVKNELAKAENVIADHVRSEEERKNELNRKKHIQKELEGSLDELQETVLFLQAELQLKEQASGALEGIRVALTTVEEENRVLKESLGKLKSDYEQEISELTEEAQCLQEQLDTVIKDNQDLRSKAQEKSNSRRSDLPPLGFRKSSGSSLWLNSSLFSDLDPGVSTSHNLECVNFTLWANSLSKNKTILYESNELQIGVQVTQLAEFWMMDMFIGNKSSAPLENLSTEIMCPHQFLLIKINCVLEEGPVFPGNAAHRSIAFKVVEFFQDSPILKLKYSGKEFDLLLPITPLLRFATGMPRGLTTTPLQISIPDINGSTLESLTGAINFHQQFSVEAVDDPESVIMRCQNSVITIKRSTGISISINTESDLDKNNIESLVVQLLSAWTSPK